MAREIAEAAVAETEAASAPVVAQRIDMRELKGLAAAEGWLLGALLVEPPMLDKFRQELTLSLFQTFTPLAASAFSMSFARSEVASLVR